MKCRQGFGRLRLAAAAATICGPRTYLECFGSCSKEIWKLKTSYAIERNHPLHRVGSVVRDSPTYH